MADAESLVDGCDFEPVNFNMDLMGVVLVDVVLVGVVLVGVASCLFTVMVGMSIQARDVDSMAMAWRAIHTTFEEG